MKNIKQTINDKALISRISTFSMLTRKSVFLDESDNYNINKVDLDVMDSVLSFLNVHEEIANCLSKIKVNNKKKKFEIELFTKPKNSAMVNQIKPSFYAFLRDMELNIQILNIDEDMGTKKSWELSFVNPAQDDEMISKIKNKYPDAIIKKGKK